MKVKKAHVRTMLPVASAGFASFWAWFYLVLLSPYPASHAGDLSLALKLAFLVGVLALVLVGMLFQLFRPLPEYKDKGGAPQAEAEQGVA